jgi:hypothetical protein
VIFHSFRCQCGHVANPREFSHESFLRGSNVLDDWDFGTIKSVQPRGGTFRRTNSSSTSSTRPPLPPQPTTQHLSRATRDLPSSSTTTTATNTTATINAGIKSRDYAVNRDQQENQPVNSRPSVAQYTSTPTVPGYDRSNITRATIDQNDQVEKSFDTVRRAPSTISSTHSNSTLDSDHHYQHHFTYPSEESSGGSSINYDDADEEDSVGPATVRHNPYASQHEQGHGRGSTNGSGSSGSDDESANNILNTVVLPVLNSVSLFLLSLLPYKMKSHLEMKGRLMREKIKNDRFMIESPIHRLVLRFSFYVKPSLKLKERYLD